MQKIWKFSLEVTDEQIIEMPENALMLDIKTQFGKPCMWALVNPDAEKVKRKFYTFGTGHDVKVDSSILRHLGTYTMDNDRLVFHVFEIMNWEDVL